MKHAHALIACTVACMLACVNPVTAVTKTATQAAVDTLASPKSQQDIKIDVGAARDELLGETTRSKVAILADDVHDDAMRIRNDALDPAFVGPIREQALGSTTKSEIGALREELVGQPLRDDVDALKPHLDDIATSMTASVTKALDTQAQAEVAKYKTLVIGLVGAVCAMLLSLGVCVWLIRSHHKMLSKLTFQVKS